MLRYSLLAVCALLLVANRAAAFSLYEKNGNEPGPTLLLIGGIQGDEPGGFMAANLLLTHYTIHRGNVWLVPNLNFASIIARSRGVHGDMNRKFAAMAKSDPEYEIVDRIKRIIRDPQIDGVVNLHDGSGFHRKKYIDRLHNPHRWGQSTIIDQESLPGVKYGALERIASGVRDHVNANLLHPEHRFSLKNTRTRQGDEEMAKTLTYYAINEGKPAFAIEATKSFATARRVYYHLVATEAYLKAFGIEFERHFELNLDDIESAMSAQPQIALYDRRVVLDVADARRQLNYVPMKKNSELTYEASSPLVALVGKGGGYQVSYGNNHQTLLQPEFMAFDDSLEGVVIKQGTEETRVPFGTIVPVADRVAVKVPSGYRVNLIGFTKRGIENEADTWVRRRDFRTRFSVDRGGWLFRAEVYRDRNFCGMVLLDYSTQRRFSTVKWRASGVARYARNAVAIPPLAITQPDDSAGR